MTDTDVAFTAITIALLAICAGIAYAIHHSHHH
jgi:hypothetical protein